MTRAATPKVTQNLSLAERVKKKLGEQAREAGLDVSAYVTMLVVEREERKKKETKR